MRVFTRVEEAHGVEPVNNTKALGPPYFSIPASGGSGAWAG